MSTGDAVGTSLSNRALSMVTFVRPVTAAFLDDAIGAPVTLRAQHCGQLICTLNNLAVISAEMGCWPAPPSHAIWLGPGVNHEVRLFGGGKALSAFIEPSASRDFPEQTSVIAVSRFLRELLSTLVALPRRHLDSSPTAFMRSVSASSG